MNLDLSGLKSLIESRKFWIAVIGIVSAVVLFAQRLITADQLADAIVKFCAALIGAIAAEDVAYKIGQGRG